MDLNKHVFDHALIDQLVEDMKNPQKRSSAGSKAENMVMKVFQELDPDIRKCGGNKHQMDLTSSKYGFRIEVKCKRLDLGDLPSNFHGFRHSFTLILHQFVVSLSFHMEISSLLMVMK